MSASSRLTYAQSSDIRSRTFHLYRRDMKRKAIAELEFLPYLQALLRERYEDHGLRVEKYGGDANMWFGRGAAQITREPDYRCVLTSGEELFFEFQYAQAVDQLKFIDFKVSKVGKKKRGQPRVAHQDREFFYVLQSERQYAFVPCEWIMAHGEERGVPAWGNRTAYRVPRDTFFALCKDGGQPLANRIAAMESKNQILAFQDRFLAIQEDLLASEFRRVVDEEKLMRIVPKTLVGFFQVCLLLDRLGKTPDASGVWLVYLASFYSRSMPALDFARWMYCLDFLNFKCERLTANERNTLMSVLVSARQYLGQQFAAPDQHIHDIDLPSIEVLRSLLFATNLYEDIVQDSIATWEMPFAAITAIYETVPDVHAMLGTISRSKTA